MKLLPILCLFLSMQSICAQTDTLTYHFFNGDSVRSHNIGLIHSRNLTLVMLGGKAYNMEELDFVTNTEGTEKMSIKSTGSSGELEVFRRTGIGKYADFYENTTVEIAQYPYNGAYNKVNYYFDQGNGLEKLKLRNITPMLKGDPVGKKYYKKLNNLRITEGVLSVINGTLFLMYAGQIPTGEKLGNVLDKAVFGFPMTLLALIGANRRKKQLLRESFRVTNGL